MKQSRLRAYLRNRPFRNVFLSYFLSMTVISLPILMLFSGVFAYVNQYSSRRESQYYAERDFGVLTYILSNLNTGILRDYGIILSDSNIQRFAEMDNAEVFDMYTHDYSRFTTYNGCLKPMTQVAGNRTYSSIFIYLNRSDFVLLWNGFMPRDKFYDAEILQRAIDTRSGSVWLTQTALNYRPMLSFSYDLTVNGESYGKVIFNLGVNYLKSLFSEYAGGDYLLTDASGMILCAQDGALCGRNIGELTDFQPPAAEPVNTVAGEMDGDLLRMSYSSGELSLYATINLKTYAKGQYPLATLLPITVGFGLALALLAALVASIKQYQRVLSVITVLQPGAAEGECDKRRFSEWQYIRSNIVRMMNREQHIEREFSDALARLNRAQAIALQTQINPHFLLNTLQIVNFSIMEEVRRDCTATEVVSLLSDIMRENLNTPDYTVPLERELMNAERYLRIEAIRSDNAVETEMQIDPAARECYVIRFMLQPMLENAVLHGFKGAGRAAKLAIRAYLDRELMCVQVIDNGAGMDSATLEELRARLNSDTLLENKRIGLCNVNMRIRLFFGREYGLTVDSAPGEGTTVTATFPAIRC